MAMDFPDSPTIGDQFTVGDRTWVWDGSVWLAVDELNVSYNDLTDVPTEFTPSAHTHAISDVTNLQTNLDGKVSETNGAVTTASTGSNVVRNITLSTSAPSGGSDGDVWLVYEV